MFERRIYPKLVKSDERVVKKYCSRREYEVQFLEITYVNRGTRGRCMDL